MAQWAEKILYLGLILVAFGIVLRVSGYHQEYGFLHGTLLETGVTPRAFLLAGATLGVFSIAMATVYLAKATDRRIQEERDREPED